MPNITIVIETLEGTKALATTIMQALQPGDVLALHGTLGAGKTAFSQAAIKHLCGQETVVLSPTFPLVQHYPPHLWHFDLYRLEHAEEVWNIGIEEAFAEGISLIEWPEIIADIWPPHTLHLTLEYGESETQRRITVAQHADYATSELWTSLKTFS